MACCSNFWQYILPYTISALTILGWLATQVLSLVDGGRFIEGTTCDRPLARYLLVSGALAFFALLTLGIPTYLLSFTPSQRTEPAWRTTFFGFANRYRTLQQERCPNGLWPGSPRRKETSRSSISCAADDISESDCDGHEVTDAVNNDQNLLINTLHLGISCGSILANKLPQHVTKNYHGKFLPRISRAFHVWTPPRSTSEATSRTSGFANRDVMATHTITPTPSPPLSLSDPLLDSGSDDDNVDDNRKNDLNAIKGGPCSDNNIGDDGGLVKMTPSEVNLNFRRVAEGYGYNGIYSLVPSSYRSTPQWVWSLGIGAIIVVIMAALAGVGWLIYGTYEVSKSGVERCLPELYNTALSVVIINWSAPTLVILLLVIAGWC